MRAERFKISSNFLFHKLLLIFLSLVFLIVAYRSTNPDGVKGSLIVLIMLLLFLCRFFMISDIYYDSDTLYLMKRKRIKKEIALSCIQSMTFSAIGFMITGRYSYRIIYFDENNKVKRLRIFSDAFSTPIEAFIKAVRKIKPEIEPKYKEFTIRELFE